VIQENSAGATAGKPRRWILFLIVTLTIGGMLGGYAIREVVRASVSPGSPAVPAPRIVLYTSADDPVAREFIDLAQKALEIQVQFVGDTEATKTTGIAQRLIDEAKAPKAHLWWSNEELATARLIRAGVLDESTLATFAARARVIAYATTRIKDPPRTLRDVVSPAYAGRIGMARPQFGTTRAQLAALVTTHGADATESWLNALKQARVRLYDGNSAVVRGLAFGEIDIGLTDTDDVWSARREKWPVDMVFESVDTGTVSGLPSIGPLRICNTAALTRNMTDTVERAAASAALDLLRSSTFEIAMAQSDSRTMPINPEIANSFPQNAIPSPWIIDPQKLLDADETAQKLWDKVMGN
jgi:iron(III) transport system substrate-binding protein